MEVQPFAGPSMGQERYGNPLYLGSVAPSPVPMFPGFQSNPIWSPAAGSPAGFQTPFPSLGGHQPTVADSNDMWVEEHFARILESSVDRRVDAVGVLTGLAGALESRAHELRYVKP